MMTSSNEEPLTLPPSTVPTTSRLGLPPKLFVPLPLDVTPPPPGAKVRRGQSIGSGALAPVNGTIGDAVDVQLLDASITRAIELIVETEGDDSSSPSPATAATDLPMLLERLRSLGVCAVRHTSPDLLGQLGAAIREPADTLICNLLDVDGGSSLHAKVIRESGASVISGVMALATALAVKQTFIVADPGLENRVTSLVRKAGATSKMKVEGLENDYPQSDPTLVVYAMTGRRLKP